MKEILNRIYKLDCIEGIERMTKKFGNFVDCIVTSPPYNLGGDFHSNNVKYGAYKTYSDNLSEEDYQEWQINFLNSCFGILKDEGVMFYNHKNRITNGTVITPFDWIQKSKFNISQAIVMNLKSTANVDKRRFFPVHELIFVLTKKPGVKLNNHECLTDIWEAKKVSRKVSGHPATFHVDVPKRCINAATTEGQIILDPFMGSGTTALASLELNRQFIGFEISDNYIGIANERISGRG